MRAYVYEMLTHRDVRMEKEREKERRREMAVCTCTCTHTRWSDVPMVLRKLGAHYCATCYIGRRVHGEQSKGLKLVWDDSDTIFFFADHSLRNFSSSMS